MYSVQNKSAVIQLHTSKVWGFIHIRDETPPNVIRNFELSRYKKFTLCIKTAFYKSTGVCSIWDEWISAREAHYQRASRDTTVELVFTAQISKIYF